jgi:mono/diheme cytochrome c family protein
MRTNRHSRSSAGPRCTRRLAAVATAVLLSACTDGEPTAPLRPEYGVGNTASGKQIFRFETFANEGFWTDTLQLHTAVETRVSPELALAVGLKVDASDLPPGFVQSADLTSPATTVELLARNAVVGVKAEVENGRITRLGITCALCHSTVDNSVAPGIGTRLDGWANHDLNVGAIVALSPVLTSAQRRVYNSWRAGTYDPRFNIDGINGPVVIPPAYGLQGVALETYTGDGPISYWNAYVAVTQMHGRGSFADPRLGLAIVAADDRVTPRLPALLQYQLSLRTPPPPAGSFDIAAAERGRLVFNGAGRCSTCHTGTTFTDANVTLHDPRDTGMNPEYAERSATGKYRTTPLRALWQHPPYFHDGSAATLAAVVDHYNWFFRLRLTDAQKGNLIEYLKSL